MARNSSNTSTTETVTRTDLPGATSTILPRTTAPSSRQRTCSNSSREQTRSSRRMCNSTTTTRFRASISMTLTQLDSMLASLWRKKWQEKVESRADAGTPSMSSSATWRNRPESAIVSSQQSWSQSKPCRKPSDKWTLLAALQRARKRYTPFQIDSLTMTSTCSIWQSLAGWLRLTKKLWETTYKRVILRNRGRSQTPADYSRSTWARPRNLSSKTNLKRLLKP